MLDLGQKYYNKCFKTAGIETGPKCRGAAENYTKRIEGLMERAESTGQLISEEIETISIETEKWIEFITDRNSGKD